MIRYNKRKLPLQQGFTIIELVLVIILIGVLGALAYPKFSAVSEINLNSTLDKLKSDVYYAQELAIASHANYGIFINNAGAYTIYKNGNTADPALNPASFSNYVVNLSAGITIATTAAGNKIEFDSFGVPYDGNGALLVQQTVTLNGTLNLLIAPETGWIHL